jgi:hypothetical protein
MGWTTAHRLCGGGFDFEADLDLSSITGGRKTDESRLEQFKGRLPDVIDAHFSPAGPWLLAVTGKQLRIHAGVESGKSVRTLPLKKYEKVVMVEWATGSNVARWTAEVRRLRAAGPVRPLVRRSEP